jgi:hypothetical protein
VFIPRADFPFTEILGWKEEINKERRKIIFLICFGQRTSQNEGKTLTSEII